LAECRQAAREGLLAYQVAVQVTEGTASKVDFQTQYRDTYTDADHTCTKRLGKYGSSDVLVNCSLAGAAVTTAAFQLRDELAAAEEADQEAAHKGRLKALRQAAAYWNVCFPNGKVPKEFRV
jgi:hypothetical protein